MIQIQKFLGDKDLRKLFPGPGKYLAKEGLSSNGKYNDSKYKSTGSVVILPGRRFTNSSMYHIIKVNIKF